MPFCSFFKTGLLRVLFSLSLSALGSLFRYIRNSLIVVDAPRAQRHAKREIRLYQCGYG
jgi:hypothetical protein